jgi:uncharacterized protein with HEPN domain
VSRRPAAEWLDDALRSIQQIRLLCGSMTREQFKRDPAVSRAVLWELTCPGEAIAQLPESLLEREPSVPWHQVVGLRNRVVHGYYEVDLEVIWDTVQLDLDPLEQAIRALRAAPA